MFLQYTKYRDIDAVTWHDACHVTKSPRLSLRFSLGRVKGHTLNYCAEGGRAWERGYARRALDFLAEKAWLRNHGKTMMIMKFE